MMTPPPPAQFPRLAAAVLTCRRTADEHHAALRRCQAAPHDRLLRAARALACEGHQQALAAADATICGELLPRLLGGAWRGTRGDPVSPTDWHLFTRPLIDHPRRFRRAEARGPTTWRNSILISESYDATTPDGAPSDRALAQAREIRAAIAAGVWVRRDLSPWNPGSTALLLLGIDLHPDAAAAFDFTAFA